jgi:hypothetical protein
MPNLLKPALLLLLLGLILGFAAACSESDIRSVDPAEVEVSLTSDPASAEAGKPVRLTAQFTGVELASWAKAAFEVRMDGGLKLVDAEKLSTGGFGASYTFPQAGTYDIYVHLYQGDFHLTKKKQLNDGRHSQKSGIGGTA